MFSLVDSVKTCGDGAATRRVIRRAELKVQVWLVPVPYGFAPPGVHFLDAREVHSIHFGLGEVVRGNGRKGFLPGEPLVECFLGDSSYVPAVVFRGRGFQAGSIIGFLVKIASVRLLCNSPSILKWSSPQLLAPPHIRRPMPAQYLGLVFVVFSPLSLLVVHLL